MHIPVTFAVITSGADPARLAACVASITALQIPGVDVLIVGGADCAVSGPGVRHLAFDEGQTKAGWITRKKNMATAHARHETIVYFHDYHVFDAGWYEAFCAFGTDWDICMHGVQGIDGTRFFGWSMYDHPTVPRYFHVPYHRHDLLPYMYFSGGYFVARRAVMEVAPLDESLVWGECEDVEWSMRVRKRFRITVNPACVVKHNKVHDGLSFCRKLVALEPCFDSYMALHEANARQPAAETA
jgi:hypothetical protein